jgi:quinol monooxygenase YgiN
MTQSLPGTAAIRVSPGQFDPARFADVDAMNTAVSAYLIPAIRQLPGLIHYYVGVSPTGSIVHVSVWDSEEHAAQMSHLKEMVVDAAQAAEAVGVTFTPKVDYPIGWTI